MVNKTIIYKVGDIVCFINYNGLFYSAYLVTQDGVKEYLNKSYVTVNETLDELTKMAKLKLEMSYAKS